MMNSSLLNSIDIKPEKAEDHAHLSESLLANEQQLEATEAPIIIEEQVVFDETQNVHHFGGGEADVMVHSTGERQPNHWRDAWAAALFMAHQAAIFYLAFAWGVPALNHQYQSLVDPNQGDGGDGSNSTNNNNTNDNQDNNDGAGDGGGVRFLEQEDVFTDEVHFGGFLLLCFISSIGALMIGAAAIAVMIRFAEKTIQFSLFFAVFCNAMISLSFALDKQWVAFGISLAILLLVVLWCKSIWHRVPFAAANLLAALTAVQTNGGLILVSLGATAVVSIWALIWILALVGVYMRTATCEEGTCETHTNGFFFVLLFLSYYWTSEVSKNIMHVTCAGTIGTWFFAPDDASTYCSPAITDSLRRATTYSLGSICFGSLLTAILQLLHQLCHDLRRRGRGNAILLCVVEALLSVLESLVTYFNKWAMIYVGLYGYDYLTSGVKVVTLFRERGWTTIINDYLVTRALMLVSFVIGALTGCIGLALAGVTGWMSDFGGAALPLAFFVPFLCGLALSVIMLSVVASAVDTVIVSFAEAPLEFERNHPGLHAAMSQAWRMAFPEEFRQ